MRGNIVIVSGTADLTSAALSLSTSGKLQPKSYYKLCSVEVHASENITETLTVTRDSNLGANYDTELKANSISAENDSTYVPDGEVIVCPGDNIVAAVTNANTTGSVYATMILREITD